MEGNTYVSCIKINGVPILPPLMTVDIIHEMKYYKQLAIAAEKRLFNKRTTRGAVSTKTSNSGFSKKLTTRREPLEDKGSLKQESSMDEDITDVEFDMSATISTVIHRPEDDNTKIIDSDRSIRYSNEELEESIPWTGTNSDDENKFENEANIPSSSVSRSQSRSQSISISADLNPSSADTASNKSNSVAECIPAEHCKPQVPKTLDIVPMSLAGPDYTSDTRQKSKNQEDNEYIENAPKLVRQGSYVLDTPSPMLLAHMRTELISSESASPVDYVPSATIDRRREWNMTEPKVQWEQQPQPEDTANRSSKYNSINAPSKSHSFNCEGTYGKSESESPHKIYSAAKSVDCIQAMLDQEYDTKGKNVRDECEGKCITPRYDPSKFNCLPKSKTHEDCSNLSTSEKFGGSLINLRVGDPRFSIIDRVSLNNGFDEDSSESTESPSQSSRQKSSITMDKLVLVYKEVQRMHKEQMTELISRQQREQTLLQEEFEKQQVLLLNEMKKSFPKINIPPFVENVPSVNSGSPIREIENEREREEIVENLPVIDARLSGGNNSAVMHRNLSPSCDTRRPISCPLDHIYSTGSINPAQNSESTERTECHTQTSNSESSVQDKRRCLMALHKRELSQPISSTDKSDINEKGEKRNCGLEGSGDQKRLTVSRELFPLDSKTVHVPVLGNRGVYDNKHIRAVNVINAYVRGYLIRRLMQTDRIVVLKNTFKEALHCMIKLHVDAPLNRSEFNFLHRLQLQCDAASMNIVELFAQSPRKRMQIIAQDREMKRSRTAERPMSARSYSFATQRTLARKKLKEMGEYPPSSLTRSYSSRSRCQTWTSDVREKLISPSVLHQSIKRSTSAGTVRKPWR